MDIASARRLRPGDAVVAFNGPYTQQGEVVKTEGNDILGSSKD